MNSSQSNSKVYIGIVHQLKEMISNDGLQPGDKLPSERILSERLKVGRSSVREALRALELLGLIETRRGEGTFLRDFRNHTLLDLLGMFILQGDQAKMDVFVTMSMLEEQSIRLLCSKNKSLASIMNKLVENQYQFVSELFHDVIQSGQNFLTFRIWYILRDYFRLDSGDTELSSLTKELAIHMIGNIQDGNEALAVQHYRKIIELVE